MARPDDDHIPLPLYDDQGEVIAVAHVSPDIGNESRAALVALVEAARRDMDSRPDRDEIAARQAAAVARIRERNGRLLGKEGE